MRKNWIDNLRWATVLLVLLYHVVYFFNNKGVFGGAGGFGDGPQYQDVVMYVLYPWFMPLLFLLAGVSARYALAVRGGREWFRARTRKLLVPATFGLLVFQWMTGYFNTHIGGTDVLAAVPQPVKFVLWAFSGIGPLWFVQDLWLFSLLLLLVRGLLDRFDGSVLTPMALSGRKLPSAIMLCVVLLFGVLLFWLGERTLVMEPRPESADGLYNLYKPLFYLIPFLLGYLVFSRDGVQNLLGRSCLPLMGCAAVAGVVLVVTTFGENNTTPRYLGSPLNCLYGWLMCLAMMGFFKARFDGTNVAAAYLSRSSYGIYIVHYLIVASLGYMMKFYTSLPLVAIYAILVVAVFTLSPLLYEVLRRIPFVRWCVLGEKR